MAESIRSQGWNLDFKVQGLDELKKTDERVDNIVSKLKEIQKLSAIHVSAPDLSQINKLDDRLNSIERKINTINNKMGNISPRVNTNSIDDLTRSTNNAYRSTQNGIAANEKYRDSYKSMLPTVQTTSTGIKTSFEKVKDSTKGASQASEILNGKFRTISDTAINTNSKINTMNTRTGRTTSRFKDISNVGSDVINTFNNMTIALVPLGMALKNAFDQSTKLEDEYNRIKQLEIANEVSPSSAKRTINKMKKANRNLSLTYGLDQNDLARGSEELIRRGYSGKQDLGSHKYFAQSALATNESYNDIINADAPVLEQFGYKAKAGNSVKKMRKYTRNVLNKMAYIADITAGNNKEFGESFKMMGTTMHQNNQSLDTALGAVGTLSNFGVYGTMAGTSLKNIVSRLNKARNSKAITAGLADFGVSVPQLYDKHGDLKPLTSIFSMLRKGVKRNHMTSGQVSGDLQQIFGLWAFNAAQTLMAHGGDWQRNIRKSKAANGRDYIGKLAQRNLNTLQGQIKLTKAKLNDVGMQFAREIAPALTTVLKAINNILDWLGKLPKPVKRSLTYVTGVGSVIGGIKLGRGILGGFGRAFGMNTGAKASGGILSKLFGYGTTREAVKKATGKVSTKIPNGLSGIFSGNTGDVGNLTAAIPNDFRKGAGKIFKSPKKGWLARVSEANGGKLFTAGNVVSVGAGALQGGVEIAQGVDANKSRKYAQRNRSIGKGIGSLAGTGIGFGIGAMFGLGPVGAMIGSQVGDFVGGVGGDAVTGYNMKHAPKNKFSGQNMGWSFHNWQKQVGSWWNKKGGAADNIHAFTKTFGEDWRGTGRRIGSFGKWASDSWNGTKRNVGNFGKWVGNSWNGTKRNVGNFFGGVGRGIGNVGKGIGNGVNYVLSGKIGSDAHDVWKKAITQSHYFFKSLPKNFNNLKKNVGKIWSDTWQNINNNRYVKAFKKGKLIQTGLSDIEKNTRGFRQRIGKVWNNTWKSINGNRYVKAIKKGKLIQTGLKDTEKNTRSFRQNFGKTWNGIWKSAGEHLGDFNKDVHKKWDKVWGVINDNRYVKAFKKGNLFGQIFDDVRSRFDKFKKSFQKVWGKFWDGLKGAVGGFGKWIGDSWNGTVNNIKGTINDVNYAFGGNGKVFTWKKKGKKSTSKTPVPTAPKGRATMSAYANGGRISKTDFALVGEQGAELAYRNNGAFARLLGLNGAAIEKVHAGEHILNARDTKKVLSGNSGLRLGAFAGGTTKLSNSYNKINKKNHNTWNEIARHTKNKVTQTKHTVLSTTNSMAKSLDKKMDNIHEGVVNTADKTAKGFGNKFKKLKGYASDAMEDTRKVLNNGIGGINKMLVQFGGNNSVIKPIKFAKGTNGKLANDTLAMVNDAPIGDKQEAIIHNNGFYLPQGENRIVHLSKGDQVLNNAQTNKIARMFGLTHFAKGSGVSDSTLRKIAKSSLKHPTASFNNMFTKNVKVSGTDLQQDIINSSKGAAKSLGYNWNKAMWTVIDEAMGGAAGHGGTREAFLKYAEANFTGKPYQMGAMGPNYYDCSGMVAKALAHYGINIGRDTVAMQHSNGVEYLGKKLSATRAGDLVIYGHGSGAAGHVGIIKNPNSGSMFNETPPSARVSAIADDMGMGYGFYRVRALRDATQKKAKKDDKLIALAKKELGSNALAWIKKHLSESLSGFKLGGDNASRINKLAKALRSADPKATKNGIAAVIGNWLFESGLDPSAVNSSGGASGLGQWLGGRLANLKAFAKKRNTSWTNPATQLLFALKHDGSDSATFRSILEGKGSVSSLANKFSSLWERGGYNQSHVNGALEAAKVLGYKNGGHPAPNTPVRINEEKGELAEFKSPVHIFSKEDAEKQLEFTASDRKRVRKNTSSRPVNITINITGNNIDSKEREDSIAKKVRAAVRQALAEEMNVLGDEFGDDPSIF